jgi:hypothetical protein
MFKTSVALAVAAVPEGVALGAQCCDDLLARGQAGIEADERCARGHTPPTSGKR